jgi:hypothetical protein
MYSQFDMLYYLIPHVPPPSIDLLKPTLGLHDDGVIGSISHDSIVHFVYLIIYMTIYHSHIETMQSLKNALVPTQTSNIHPIQSTNPKND